MLVITNWRDLDHPEGGGAEVVCQELAARWAAAGRDVVLLCADVEGRPAVEHRDGYRIVRAGGRLTVYARALRWLFEHRGEIEAVLDSQNGIPFFTPLAVGRRTPVLLLMHHVHQDQFAKYFSRPMAAVGRWLESTGSRTVYGRRGVVAVSPSTRTDTRRRLRLPGEIWVAPPGWSVTEAVRLDPPARSEEPVVVCLGRLVPHKRTHLVLRAFPSVLARVPNARLVVVGRGTEAHALRDLAGELSIAARVEFREDLDDAGRDAVMAAAWLSVNASQGEGWGLSVVEGNALGTPALAYRRPGLRDSIVHEQTGWLLDDAEDLGDGIVNALEELSDEGRARQLSQHVRRWASRFTWETMLERIDVAFSVEERRLALGKQDRRSQSDVSTVISFPTAVLPLEWSALVRAGDVCDVSGDVLTIVCRGSDTEGVARLLDRLGIRDHDASLTVSVARTADLLRTSTGLTA